MNEKAATYQLKFIDKTYSNDYWTFNKKVIVSIYIENKIISKNTYGLLTHGDILEKFEKTKSLNLDGCYIKNFSTTELKSKLGDDNTSSLLFESFSAQDTFFDCTLETDFSLAHFNGDVSFLNTIFSHGNVSFLKTKFNNGEVNFKNVRFGNGEINFQYADFGNQKVTFYNSIFYGGIVSFVNANFNDGDVNFGGINFNNSKVKFHFAKFGNGDINFQKTKFGNQTFDCRRVEFGTGKLDFRRAIFGDGYVTFDESELTSGKINFKSTRFGSNDISFKQVDYANCELLFESVSFGTGGAYFYDSTIKNIIFKDSRIDVYLDLRVAKCNEIDLSDTILKGIVDLQPDSNDKIQLNTLSINGMRNLGKFIIDWDKNNVKSLIKSQTNTSLRSKAEQFIILKENFHTNGQYEDEDNAYIQFKRFQQRANVAETIQKGGVSLLKLPYYLFRWIVFDKMGLFATNPLRVLLSMLIIYTLFSLTYFILHFFNLGTLINAVGATDGLSYLQTSFYHSAITFLTIGYGDYYPTGISRGISILEGWTGVFLMSYFTVAFVRKILR